MVSMVSAIHGFGNTLLPCGEESYSALSRIQQHAPKSKISVSINSQFNVAENMLNGWFVRFSPETPVSLVPFTSTMFEGITVVETLANELEILDFLKNKETVLENMKSIVAQFLPANNPNRVSWYRCRPQRNVPLQKTSTWRLTLKKENLSRYSTIGKAGGMITLADDAPFDLVPDETVPNYIDSSEWTPELSTGGSIGLYHQWYSDIEGKRVLKMYFVCHGNCQLPGIEIKQIVNDIPAETAVKELAASEEVWWLQTVNLRNRSRLIYEVANRMQIKIPVIEDVYASQNANMAKYLANTFFHSMHVDNDGMIAVANDCVSTALATNGVVCALAPWEGICIFKGPHVSYSKKFGTSFGSNRDVFPVRSVPLSALAQESARKIGYMVQSSSPSEHSFWFDTWYNSMPRKHTSSLSMHSKKAALSDGSDNDDNDDDDDEKYLAGFPGIADAELNAIARKAWIRAKKNLCKKEKKLVQNGLQTHTPTKLSALDRFSFISFEDNMVLEKLKISGWDPRYGMFRLFPMSLYTHTRSA